MKKLSRVLAGLIIIAIGVAVTLDILNVINIDYAAILKGWWTMLIIVPCLLAIISNGPRTGNCIGLAVGILLFLGAWGNILSFSTAAKLIFPAIIIIVGVSIIAKTLIKSKKTVEFEEKTRKAKESVGEDYTSTFAGQTLTFVGETLKSFTTNAIFGGVKVDLRGAALSEDIVIEASAIFGGIDFIVPPEMPVKIKSNSIFGGIDNKRKNLPEYPEGTPTIYIKGTCIFGGIDIK